LDSYDRNMGTDYIWVLHHGAPCVLIALEP
jgi:hypothetical protein